MKLHAASGWGIKTKYPPDGREFTPKRLIKWNLYYFFIISLKFALLYNYMYCAYKNNNGKLIRNV